MLIKHKYFLFGIALGATIVYSAYLMIPDEDRSQTPNSSKTRCSTQ